MRHGLKRVIAEVSVLGYLVCLVRCLRNSRNALLIFIFGGALLVTVVSANADNNAPCVTDDAIPESRCLSQTELENLRRTVNELYKEKKFGELYSKLKDMNIDEDAGLLMERAGIYVWQTSKHNNLCSAVNDFEKAARTRPVVAISFLDVLYSGAWKQIAAYEGSMLARIKLVESRLKTAKNGWDTMRNLNSELFFGRLLSLLELKDGMHVDAYLQSELQKMKNTTLSEMKKDDLDLANLNIQYIEPVEIICNIR